MLEGIITELVDSVCRDSADTQYVCDDTKIKSLKISKAVNLSAFISMYQFIFEY